MNVDLNNYPMEMTVNVDDFVKLSPKSAPISLHNNGHDELILVDDFIIHLVYDESHRIIGKIYYKESFKLLEPNNINFKFHKIIKFKYKDGEFKPYEEIHDDLIITNIYEENKLLYSTTSKGCSLRYLYGKNKVKLMTFEVLDEDSKYLKVDFLTYDKDKEYQYKDNRGNYWHVDLGYSNPYYSINEVRNLFYSK